MGATKRGTDDNVKANRKERETGTESGRVRKKEGQTGYSRGTERERRNARRKGRERGTCTRQLVPRFATRLICAFTKSSSAGRVLLAAPGHVRIYCYIPPHRATTITTTGDDPRRRRRDATQRESRRAGNAMRYYHYYLARTRTVPSVVRSSFIVLATIHTRPCTCLKRRLQRDFKA